jgi:hypothetical protein
MGAPLKLKHPDLAGIRKWRVKDFDSDRLEPIRRRGRRPSPRHDASIQTQPGHRSLTQRRFRLTDAKNNDTGVA